jgi:hypothetical protein
MLDEYIQQILDQWREWVNLSRICVGAVEHFILVCLRAVSRAIACLLRG